jgi:hypothetical protein
MNPNAIETRLREIAERENKATKGPWDPESGLCSKCDGWHLEGPQDVGGTGILIQLGGGTDQLSDLSFIAHSRQDVPWLLELIQKQREALEKIEQYHVPHHTVSRMAQAALNFSPENL